MTFKSGWNLAFIEEILTLPDLDILCSIFFAVLLHVLSLFLEMMTLNHKDA